MERSWEGKAGENRAGKESREAAKTFYYAFCVDGNMYQQRYLRVVLSEDS